MSFLDADIDIRDHSGRKPSHHLQSTVTHDVKSKYCCVSVALFCMYDFGKFSSEVTEWVSLSSDFGKFSSEVNEQVPLSFFIERFSCYSDRFCVFSVTTPTQITFTCSKSTIETLEKDVKYVQI